MADPNKAILGGAALVAAAIVLAQKKVQAAPPGGAVTLDAETMQLLIAMAATSADIDQLLAQLIAAGTPGVPGQGYPNNTPAIMSVRVQIPATNVAYQLPDINIPDGFSVQLKGWPTNAGLIYVGNSSASAVNINQVWPLLPNEAVGYFVKNTNTIYCSGTSPGDFLVITVEQR